MNILSSIFSAIFPPKCIVCDSILDSGSQTFFLVRREVVVEVRQTDEKTHICSACNSSINWLSSDFFSSFLTRQYFTRGLSLAAYDGSFAQAIHNFKYNKRTDLAKPLGNLMAEKIGYEYDIVTPIPLHAKRLRRRGYNQSALLAMRISKETGFLYEPELLKRVKNSPPQVGLEQKKRLKNVKGIFTLRACREDKIKGRDILLIDDVMTTGATVNECAKVLKKAGAERVDVFTVARTV